MLTIEGRISIELTVQKAVMEARRHQSSVKLAFNEYTDIVGAMDTEAKVLVRYRAYLAFEGRLEPENKGLHS